MARAGIARETLGRLERLRRRAQRETVQALAHALGVSEAVLATPTDGLPAILSPTRSVRLD
jgi:transcriptional regulator with XRE-family HTH domain